MIRTNEVERLHTSLADPIVWGVAAGTHDGSLCVMQGDKILFASHSERYSRRKNDKDLNQQIVDAALLFGEPTVVYWYENPIWKATRKIYARQKNKWMNPSKYLARYGITAPVKWGDHHMSHLAAGYYTSEFDNCAVLVIDAIGEWDTTSIWDINEGRIKQKDGWSYPYSLGLFYSAFTDRVGLKANEDEYILMGMSAYGNPDRLKAEIKYLIAEGLTFHKGVRPWRPDLVTEEDHFDIAAAVQSIYEDELRILLEKAQRYTGKDNIVLMGGCALNCLANRIVDEYFDKSWIMPNPGDAGSSLGAIVSHTQSKVKKFSPYLGHTIAGKYPVEALLAELTKTGMAGVASGAAEFGPRALGNRSLLADPRGKKMKDKVNKIKNRQEYRPFAPVIRQEDVSDYFWVDKDFQSPYMQFIVKCKDTKAFPAIVHQDGSSRVQTVTKKEHPGLYALLTKWKEKTGCPMLLNTSLNIKGQPIVNTINDAIEFERKYNVKVMS